jgi:hypothetical protein
VETSRSWEIREKPVEAKKVPLSLYVSPEVRRFIEAQAKREDRTPSNLCDRMLAWSAKWLEKAQSSDLLMHWTAGPGAATRLARRSKRVSEETQEQLHEALDLIFERAPLTAIEKVTEFLTDRAGKYGDEK